MNWKNNKREYEDITDFPLGCVGFIYIITNLETNKYYIGKKSLYHNITKKLTKKEISEQTGPGRKSLKKKIIKESDWKTYYGSNKELIEEVKQKGGDKFKREILKFCSNKKQLSYYELYYQFKYNVLEDKLSYNENLLGKFFRKDLIP
jgi:hypothetical protein